MSVSKRMWAGLFAVLFTITSAVPLASAGPGDGGPWAPGSMLWEYNMGPDPSTPMGRALIDLFAEMPEYMYMSDQLMDSQKFRYIFGLMMTRTYFEKNATKILFIGQDATHIAEAAKQPGTSGFGARVQSVGNFFGVDQGVSTTNAFLSTIKGQYGAFEHVYVEVDKDGVPQFRKGSYVDNELWMLANGADSEIVLKREIFWEWMIRNNPDSMKMMVMFGGAARDAFGEFLAKRGFKVGRRITDDRLKSIQVPETRLVYAGGNNEFPVPVDKNGRDIYEVLLGRKLNYKDVKEQQLAYETLKNSGQRALDMMVFTGGGVNGSGVVNGAQLGGYNLDEVYNANGEKVNSLKGLVLSDGYVVPDHLAFTMSPHPSSLSKMTVEAASQALQKAFARLKNLLALGWDIAPDLDESGKPMTNRWKAGEAYEYGRADIRPGYFEFGAPDDRRVSRADASRLDPQSIVAGSRAREKFDQRKITSAKEGKPSKKMNPDDLWSVRPRQKDTRYIFDRGPGKKFAQAMMESIDREVLFAPKQGMAVLDKSGAVDHAKTFAKHGIEAYNTKTHAGTGLFGHTRGDFSTAEAFIAADPHGIDDWNTSRAMTGARGQTLNGMMEDLGFGEKYAVGKTVPVGMDGATAEEWEHVRRSTEKYREVMYGEAFKNKKLKVVFTDGPIARAEVERVMKKLGVAGIPVIDIPRESMDPGEGIERAAREAQTKIRGLNQKKVVAHMADIPRIHLPWWARSWEGTSGDLVIDALGKTKGGVRLLVTPNWVVRQKVRPLPAVQESVSKIKNLLEKAGIRLGNEPIQDFLSRKGLLDGGKFKFSIIQSLRAKAGIRRSGLRPGELANPFCSDLGKIPLDFNADIGPAL